MMGREAELDRSEAATPHKLRDARTRGQVAKSADAVAAIVFAAAVVYLQARGWDDLREQFRLDRLLLAQAGTWDGGAAVPWRLARQVLSETMRLVAPLLLVLMVAAVAGNVAQTGPVLAVRALAPDWNRVNPAHGVRRFFSARTAFDALRAGVKLAVLATVVALALQAALPAMHRLPDLTPAGQARALLGDIAALGLRLALALGLIAVLDLAYTRREHARRMRMSRRELREEHRHREGDPRVRARLRELRREMLRRSAALRRTRDADLLVTNPTHCAVALRYRHGEMDAPQLVAKGAGVMAQAMRALAARHRVPVVRHPALARALYAQAGIDQHVPPGLYADVARLMVWMLAARPGPCAAAESRP